MKNKDIKNKNKKTSKNSKIKDLFRSRKFKRGAIGAFLTILFIAVIVALNIAAGFLTERFDALSYDMTKNKSYKLQSETIEYINSLDDEINIYVLQKESDFEANDDYYVQANKLLKSMEKASDKISLEYIDLKSNPGFSSDYPEVDWSSSHLLLVKSKDQYRKLDAEDLFDYNQAYIDYYGTYVIESQHVEQAVLTAILNVTTQDKVKVTVLEGQGEEDSSSLQKLLLNNAYEIEKVSLLTCNIDKESKFVIIFDPAEDIDQDVYKTLSDWLYNDGKYGHTLIYIPNDMKKTSKFENLNTLIGEWGMKITEGYTYETKPAYMTNSQNPNLISVFDYADDKYTAGLKNLSIPVLLYFTMPIEITDESLTSALLTTSDEAVVMPLGASDEWKPNKKEAKTLNGAVLATKSNEEGYSSNVLVIGSYDAFSEGALSSNSVNNAQYFLNVFNKIADKDNVGISIEGKSLDSKELGITNASLALTLKIIFIYVIPIFILIIGFIIWLKRKNK